MAVIVSPFADAYSTSKISPDKTTALSKEPTGVAAAAKKLTQQVEKHEMIYGKLLDPKTHDFTSLVNGYKVYHYLFYEDNADRKESTLYECDSRKCEMIHIYKTDPRTQTIAPGVSDEKSDIK